MGWSAPPVVALFALALTLFVWQEAHAPAPLLPPGIVLDRQRGAAYVSALLAAAGMFGAFLFLTYTLQVGMGFTPLLGGLAFLPMSAASVLAGTLLAPRLLLRASPRGVMVTGFVLAACGMAVLGRLQAGSSYATGVLPAEILLGLGVASVMMPASQLATSRVGQRTAGIASATLNAALQVGASLGTTLLNTLAATATAAFLASSLSATPADGLVHGPTRRPPRGARWCYSLARRLRSPFRLANSSESVGADGPPDGLDVGANGTRRVCINMSLVTRNPPASEVQVGAALRKVPEVTVLFWIVKLLSTALGESTTDYLVFQIDPYVAVALGLVGLCGALLLQFVVRHYVPWIYWLAVVMVAVFGTMAADVLHVVLGISYLASTLLFGVTLTLVFVAWYLSERTLSIHTINTRPREVFYWATVIASFALGTAAGDMTASTLGLGYFASVVLFAILFVAPGVAWRFFGLNAVVAFWFAYVVTRPLGASVADWLGKSALGGLGLGDGPVALVLGVLIVVCVGYLTLTRGAEPARA